MTDLSTSFLGKKIRNPIIISSSPLTESAESILECEKHGAGAVIAKSCSSTRITQQGYRRCLIDTKGWWVSSTYNREVQDVNKAIIYLRNAVVKTSIPIFASVSEMSLDINNWMKTCQLVQKTGISGIQLDLFYLENTLNTINFRENFIELLSSLQEKLEIPIFPKLNINLPSLYMADIFKASKINNVSLLDSIRLPAPISIENSGSIKMRHVSKIKTASLFGKWQFPLTMKYLYDFTLKEFSVCAGGGIQDSKDIIELLLLGAQTVQVSTVIILEGYKKISELLSGIESYMTNYNFESIDDIRGNALFHLTGERRYQKAKVKYHAFLCSRCKKCVSQAFCSAITNIGDDIVINEILCEGCSLCIDLCDSKALSFY